MGQESGDGGQESGRKGGAFMSDLLNETEAEFKERIAQDMESGALCVEKAYQELISAMELLSKAMNMDVYELMRKVFRQRSDEREDTKAFRAWFDSQKDGKIRTALYYRELEILQLKRQKLLEQLQLSEEQMKLLGIKEEES